jgi:hypothetical protein
VRRSRVFALVVERAKWFARNPDALRQLFQEAVRKTKSIPRAPFRDLWAYLQAMLREFERITAVNIATLSSPISC